MLVLCKKLFVYGNIIIINIVSRLSRYYFSRVLKNLFKNKSQLSQQKIKSYFSLKEQLLIFDLNSRLWSATELPKAPNLACIGAQFKTFFFRGSLHPFQTLQAVSLSSKILGFHNEIMCSKKNQLII